MQHIEDTGIDDTRCMAGRGEIGDNAVAVVCVVVDDDDDDDDVNGDVGTCPDFCGEIA